MTLIICPIDPDYSHITTANLLNYRVVPLFDEQGIKLQRILSGRGTEYCRKPDNHPYQLYLAVEDIDHSRTKANHPQTNGIRERFHKTLQDECYSLLFRKKLYPTLEGSQMDLDAWLGKYNKERPHSGRYCYGKTPWESFQQSRYLTLKKVLSRGGDQPDNTTPQLSAVRSFPCVSCGLDSYTFLGSRTCSHLAAVLVHGLIPYPEHPVFDTPMAPPPFQQTGGTGLLWRETGYGLRQLPAGLAFVVDDAFRPAHLGQVRPVAVVDQFCRCPEATRTHPVPMTAGLHCLGRHILFSQVGSVLFQRGLVVLYREEVVPFLLRYSGIPPAG